MFSVLWVKTYRELWLKKSLVLTLSLVLMIASGAYIGMSSVYQDMKMARDQYYLKYHLADFSVLCSAVPHHMLSSLRKISNVDRVQGRVRTRVTFQHLLPGGGVLAGEAYSIPVSGDDSLNGLHLQAGVFPKPHSYDIVVLAQFAKAHALHIGESISIVFAAGVRSMRIVGEVYSPEQVIVFSPDAITLTPQEFHFGVVYVPETTLAELSGLREQYNDIMVTTHNHSLPANTSTMQHVAHQLEEYGVKYKLLSKDQMSVNLLDAEIENIRIISTFFPFLFLFVGALVINVLLQRLVKQQQVIIGMLKAIGLSRLSLIWHYLSYGVVIGVIGSVLGLCLGLWIQSAMVTLYQNYFQLPLLAFHLHLLPVLFGMGISIIAAVLGAMMSTLHAVRLSPVEAMRPDAATGKSQRQAWQANVWLQCPFYLKMALRSIVRDGWRSLVGILTVVLGLTLVYMALTMERSMLNMVNLSIDNLNHYDVAISLREPTGFHIIDSLVNLPSVQEFETQLALPITIRSGEYHKEVVVEGLPTNNRLFTPIDQSSHPVHIPSRGLVLSRALAKILHVKVGDSVAMQPLLGHRTAILVPVVGLVKTYLGLPAYANQSWLSHVVDSDGAFNKIFLKLYHQHNIASLKRAMQSLQNVTSIQYTGSIKADIIKTLDQFLGGFIIIIILFAATIAVSSLYNNAMVSLNERQRDVATFSVLGLHRWEIFRIFCLEGAILLLLGLIVGLPLSYYFSKWMLLSFQTEFFRFPVRLYIAGLFQAAAMTLLFFVLSYIVVWRYICKVSWQGLLNIRE